MPSQTPTLHLSLGDDADENRNWSILDLAMERLARSGTIVPNDLTVQGDLDVSLSAHIGGNLVVDGNIDANIIRASQLFTSDRIQAGGQLEGNNGLLITDGFIVVPPNSIDGAAFWKNAPVQGVWIGTPVTTQTAIPVGADNAVTLATVALDATEEGGRWELVIAQGTLRFILVSDKANAGGVQTTLALTRGPAPGTIHQTRTFTYTARYQGQQDYPFTIVRLLQPSMSAEEPRWNLTAWNANFITDYTLAATFAQLHVLQLR